MAKPETKGIVILSSILGINSASEANIAPIKDSCGCIKNEPTKNEVKKHAKTPSKLFEPILVFPYLIPMSVEKASPTVSIAHAAKAMDKGKIIKARLQPK